MKSQIKHLSPRLEYFYSVIATTSTLLFSLACGSGGGASAPSTDSNAMDLLSKGGAIEHFETTPDIDIKSWNRVNLPVINNGNTLIFSADIEGDYELLYVQNGTVTRFGIPGLAYSPDRFNPTPKTFFTLSQYDYKSDEDKHLAIKFEDPNLTTLGTWTSEAYYNSAVTSYYGENEGPFEYLGNLYFITKTYDNDQVFRNITGT